MNRQLPKRIPPALGIIVLLCVLLSACSKEDAYIGTYKCLDVCPSKFADLYVELKPGGEGIRRVRGHEISFNWTAKGDEIRFHTESGGTIVGTLKNGILEVKLPGPRMVRLQKIDKK